MSDVQDFTSSKSEYHEDIQALEGCGDDGQEIAGDNRLGMIVNER